MKIKNIIYDFWFPLVLIVVGGFFMYQAQTSTDGFAALGTAILALLLWFVALITIIALVLKNIYKWRFVWWKKGIFYISMFVVGYTLLIIIANFGG